MMNFAIARPPARQRKPWPQLGLELQAEIEPGAWDWAAGRAGRAGRAGHAVATDLEGGEEAGEGERVDEDVVKGPADHLWQGREWVGA